MKATQQTCAALGKGLHSLSDRSPNVQTERCGSLRDGQEPVEGALHLGPHVQIVPHRETHWHLELRGALASHNHCGQAMSRLPPWNSPLQIVRPLSGGLPSLVGIEHHDGAVPYFVLRRRHRWRLVPRHDVIRRFK